MNAGIASHARTVELPRAALDLVRWELELLASGELADGLGG
ncbi:MAG TPA: hypothetical protein VLL82_15555 [Mycobacterium sp.]|nr:hypothetical protein [Mycobacterium sp.]